MHGAGRVNISCIGPIITSSDPSDYEIYFSNDVSVNT